MSPIALVFFGIPTTLAVIDEGLKGLLMLRDLRRAKKRIDEVGEETEAPNINEVDDDMLYPVSFDSLLPGRVVKELNKSAIWQDMKRGAEMAQRAKQSGQAHCCSACGRFAMN